MTQSAGIGHAHVLLMDYCAQSAHFSHTAARPFKSKESDLTSWVTLHLGDLEEWERMRRSLCFLRLAWAWALLSPTRKTERMQKHQAPFQSAAARGEIVRRLLTVEPSIRTGSSPAGTRTRQQLTVCSQHCGTGCLCPLGHFWMALALCHLPAIAQYLLPLPDYREH